MKKKTPRRAFLKTATALPVCAVGAGLGMSPLSATEPIKRAGGSHLKISLNAYSFKDLLMQHLEGTGPGMSLFELLEFCAVHNFDALDPTGYFFPGYPDMPEDSYINEFKRRAFQLGLDISGTGVRNDFATPDKAARKAGLEHVREWCEVAAKMGAPVLRVFAGRVPEGYEDKWDEVADWMADCLSQCAEYGKEFGVLIGVQNHGGMLKTAEETLKIVNRVDSEWFGVVVDTGYFKTKDPYIDMARVMPYAVNFQVKESPFGRESDVRIDLDRLLKLIHASNYRGYLPIETLVNPNRAYDPNVLVPAFLEELREALERAGRSAG